MTNIPPYLIKTLCCCNPWKFWTKKIPHPSEILVRVLLIPFHSWAFFQNLNSLKLIILWLTLSLPIWWVAQVTPDQGLILIQKLHNNQWLVHNSKEMLNLKKHLRLENHQEERQKMYKKLQIMAKLRLMKW